MTLIRAQFCGVCSLILFVVSCSYCQSRVEVTAELKRQKNEIDIFEDEDLEIDDLFHKMTRKRVPFYKCSGSLRGFKYKIGESMSCGMSLKKEPSKSVKVGVWTEEIDLQSIPAKECYAVKTSVFLEYCLFSAGRVWVEYNKESITSADCHKMATLSEAPDNREALRELGAGIYGTERIPDLNWPPICNTYEESVVNYYMTNVTLVVNDFGKTIQTMGATRMVDKCEVTAGKCTTTKGILVWNATDMPSCRMVLHARTVGVFLLESRRLILPDLQWIIPEVKTTLQCNTMVGVSDQGIVITQEDEEQLGENITTTTDFRAFTYAKTGVHTRIARSTSEGSLEYAKDARDDLRFTSAADLNYRFEFLKGMIENVTTNLKMFEYEICNANKRLMENLVVQAELGNPSVLARSLIGDGMYTAKMFGDVLQVWKCKEVRRYKLLPKEATACYDEWPILYKERKNTFIGYLTGVNHIIADNFVPRFDCKVPIFYLDLGHRVFKLGNRTTVAEIQTLTISAEPAVMNFSSVSFDGLDTHSVAEITGQETLLDMLREGFGGMTVQNAVKVFKTVPNQGKTNYSDDNILDHISEEAISEMKSYIHSVVVTVAVCVSLLQCIYHCIFKRKCIEWINFLST